MVGAVLAGARDEQVEQLEEVGTLIGIAFQIQDDILDVVGEQEVIGKPVHSDEKNEKSTYVAIHGLEQAGQKVREYTDRGLQILRDLEVKEETSRRFLAELMESLVGREK